MGGVPRVPTGARPFSSLPILIILEETNMFNLLKIFGSDNISAQNCPECSEGPPLAGVPPALIVYPGKRAATFSFVFLGPAGSAGRCAWDPWPRSSGPDRITWAAHSRVLPSRIWMAPRCSEVVRGSPGTVRQGRHRGGIFPPIAVRQRPNCRTVRGFLPHGAGLVISGSYLLRLGCPAVRHVKNPTRSILVPDG